MQPMHLYLPYQPTTIFLSCQSHALLKHSPLEKALHALAVDTIDELRLALDLKLVVNSNGDDSAENLDEINLEDLNLDDDAAQDLLNGLNDLFGGFPDLLGGQ